MIPYEHEIPLGLNVVWRLSSGSAVYRAMLPALASVGLLLFIRFVLHNVESHPEPTDELFHPFSLGAALTSSISLLLMIRLQQAYARYIEATSSVFHMMSKWMDAVIHIACYHLQCSHYDTIKPPSFFDYPQYNQSSFFTRYRQEELNETKTATTQSSSSRRRTKLVQQHTSTTTATSASEPITFPDVEQQPMKAENISKHNKRHQKSIEFVVSVDNPQESQTCTRNWEYDIRQQPPQQQQQPEQLSSSLSWEDSSCQTDACGNGNSRIYNNNNNNSVEAAQKEVSQAVSAVSAAKQEEPEQPIKPCRLVGPPRMDGNWGAYYSSFSTKALPTSIYKTNENDNNDSHTTTNTRNNYNSAAGLESIHGPGRTPPLFLQELCHLASLLTAVAFSTFRSIALEENNALGTDFNNNYNNDIFLEPYQPGAPWPQVDPDQIQTTITTATTNTPQTQEELPTPVPWTYKLKLFLGFGRSLDDRKHYNRSRPFSVIGGVSPAELECLNRARGPYAKTTLCWFWLSEFVTREHLAGSTGKVGPPIISRFMQFVSDGMTYYNQARKITWIPFPFVHAQATTFFALCLVVPAVAFLMDQYIGNVWLGTFFSFWTVTIFIGVHEVATELEDPFWNAPNELPLNHLQAQFNEALLVMFSGYHPDAYWQQTTRNASCDAAAEPETEAAKTNAQTAQHAPTTASAT